MLVLALQPRDGSQSNHKRLQEAGKLLSALNLELIVVVACFTSGLERCWQNIKHLFYRT
jgi:hypothetical protein